MNLILSYLKGSYFLSIHSYCIAISPCGIQLRIRKVKLMILLLMVYSTCHCTPLMAQPFNKVWAWVGLIEQINPPWIIISGEYRESVQLQMSNTQATLKEGDWVIYFPRSKHIMPIKSDHFMYLTRELEEWVKTQDEFHHGIPLHYSLP